MRTRHTCYDDFGGPDRQVRAPDVDAVRHGKELFESPAIPRTPASITQFFLPARASRFGPPKTRKLTRADQQKLDRGSGRVGTLPNR